MKIAKLATKAVSPFGRQILTVQKHSPAILLGVGITGFVTTVVLATRATLQLEEVLKDIEHGDTMVEKAAAIAEKNDKDYDEEDANKDKLRIRVKAAAKVAKLYAPAVIVGVASIGCLTGSHIILSRRNVGLTAAYKALETGFKEYRERVVEELGEEKDQEFRYGVLEREIAVETDEGLAVKTVRGLDQNKGASIYARFFDENSKNWSPVPSVNQLFIQAQQNWANDLLRGRGHVFLNEVYDMLGLERTTAGQVVGWVKGNGDDIIDFGVLRGNIYEGQRFINGDERSVHLDFNVDGVVYDLLGD